MRQFFHPSTNTYIGAGRGFTIGQTQYPGNWLEHASAAEMASRGIVEVTTIGQRGDDRYFNNAEVLNSGVLTITSTPKDVSTAKAAKSAEISAARYALETGGINLPGGSRISTDRDSQAMITGALLTVQRNPAAIIDWKGETGWVQLDKPAVEAIADAVSHHVQACFSAERAKHEALAALTTFAEIIAFQAEISLPE